MTGCPQIHRDLIRMYERVRAQATIATIDLASGAPLEHLRLLRRENGNVRPTMTIRERAWRTGTLEVLDSLIEAAASTTGPDEGDARHGL